MLNIIQTLFRTVAPIKVNKSVPSFKEFVNRISEIKMAGEVINNMYNFTFFSFFLCPWSILAVCNRTEHD